MSHARSIAFLALVCSTAALAAPPRYRITLLDQSPDLPGRCEPIGISNAGHIVGNCIEQFGFPFLWTPGVGIQPVPPPPGAASADVEGVNASGVVVGTAAGQAFTWSLAQGHRLLGTLSAEAPGSGATAINDAGQVAGASVGGPGQDWQAFRWSVETGMVDLSGPRDIQSYAFAINALGEVAGHDYQAGLAYVVDAAGHASPRRPIKSGTGSMVFGLNDTHEVVGFSTDRRGNQRATLWSASGKPFVLDQRPLFQVYSVAHNINNAGQVVGIWREGRDNFPFYWDAVEGMHPLDSLIDPADPLRGVLTISGLRPRINQSGQIAAMGSRSGESRPVLLTPLPVE